MKRCHGSITAAGTASDEERQAPASSASDQTQPDTQLHGSRPADYALLTEEHAFARQIDPDHRRRICACHHCVEHALRLRRTSHRQDDFEFCCLCPNSSSACAVSLGNAGSYWP